MSNGYVDVNFVIKQLMQIEREKVLGKYTERTLTATIIHYKMFNIVSLIPLIKYMAWLI